MFTSDEEGPFWMSPAEERGLIVCVSIAPKTSRFHLIKTKTGASFTKSVKIHLATKWISMNHEKTLPASCLNRTLQLQI